MSERDSKRTFRTVIVQTEVERVKFLVRSYLRARLHKVAFSRDEVNCRLTSMLNISFLHRKFLVYYRWMNDNTYKSISSCRSVIDVDIMLC